MSFIKCNYCGELQHLEDVKESTTRYYILAGYKDYTFSEDHAICPSCGIGMDQGNL